LADIDPGLIPSASHTRSRYSLAFRGSAGPGAQRSGAIDVEVQFTLRRSGTHASRTTSRPLGSTLVLLKARRSSPGSDTARGLASSTVTSSSDARRFWACRRAGPLSSPRLRPPRVRCAGWRVYPSPPAPLLSTAFFWPVTCPPSLSPSMVAHQKFGCRRLRSLVSAHLPTDGPPSLSSCFSRFQGLRLEVLFAPLPGRRQRLSSRFHNLSLFPDLLSGSGPTFPAAVTRTASFARFGLGPLVGAFCDFSYGNTGSELS